MKRSLQVGVTGGIGAGKSLVCRIFQCFGAPVYDADARAKGLMATDKVLVELIKNEFGSEAYLPDNKPNRSYLASITFSQPEKLKRLNGLVHPRVAIDYATWVQEHEASSYVIREAALLYEASAYKSVDKMIVVSAPEEVRLKRTLLRDPQRTENDVRLIMKNQWSEEEKLKRADYVVVNDDVHMVIPQVLDLHRIFITSAE